jgi:hypothetical protein
MTAIAAKQTIGFVGRVVRETAASRGRFQSKVVASEGLEPPTKGL